MCAHVCTMLRVDQRLEGAWILDGYMDEMDRGILTCSPKMQVGQRFSISDHSKQGRRHGVNIGGDEYFF